MSTPDIDLVPATDGYRPGACNIGPAEIARRRRAGIVGLAAAAVLGRAIEDPSVDFAVTLPGAGGPWVAADSAKCTTP